MQTRQSTETELWCGPCGTMHPKHEFGKDRNSPDGLAYACKSVVSERNRRAHSKARKSNAERHARLRQDRRNSANSREWAVKKLLSDARRRAVARGFEFSLTVAEIDLPDTCPIFGFRLVYQAKGKRVNESASIDRIDSQRGYVPGNVWIISWRANQLKSDATAEELRTVADAIEAKAGRMLDGVTHDGFPGAA